MTGYLPLTKGDASLARKGWFAMIRAEMGVSLTQSSDTGLVLLMPYLQPEWLKRPSSDFWAGMRAMNEIARG